MNKARLKSYAPAARREFIQAVTDRAHFFGLSEKEIVPVEEKGDLAIIGGRPFARIVAAQRKKLEERVKRDGFNQVMEAVAYTWFNRFLALRFMELHSYLEHGFRILSNPSGSTIPEILDHATQVDLPGLDKQKVLELKLDGSKDAELYRIILVAQCNALNAAMPFLFEKIDDETELLLPDNLLHSDSLIRKLVTGIDEEDWLEVEIIGWLYQFYISEKKDQVIGKVVKSEDIPAATQLFTPNWIVKYMVQNSLGRQWLATYPDSPLRQKMEYYIEPAEQTEEVKAQLKAITPNSLDPELLTLLDPASGSGHILVEAYDLLKEIYLERGYSSRDFPRLILEKNLYGLDIDDRAAQMAGFALLMKARKDDRRILQNGNPPMLNVMAIQGSEGLDTKEIANALLPRPQGEGWGEGGVTPADITQLIDLFKQGKTFGSLITVPEALTDKLPAMARLVEENLSSGDLFAQDAARSLQPFVRQAAILAGKYDCVVANPPYMGGKYLTPILKGYLKDNYKDFEKDLFSAFMIRNLSFAADCGQLGFMSPFVWMFITSYEDLRRHIIEKNTLTSLVQLEYSGFDGATVPICTFTLAKAHISDFTGSYIRLADFRGADQQGPKTLEAIQNHKCGWFYTAKPDDFQKIPGSPVAYWVNWTHVFATPCLSVRYISGGRNKTHDNEKYLRFWWEISNGNTDWRTYANGGDFRKYYGNELHVVHWTDEARNFYNSHGGLCNEKFWDREGVTWSLITSALPSFRIKSMSAIYSSGSPTIFSGESEHVDLDVIAFLNSPISISLLRAINPTLNTTVGDVCSLPYKKIGTVSQVIENTRECISISKTDWDSFETSWDFESFPWLSAQLKASTFEMSWQKWQTHCDTQIKQMQERETENNRLFIEAYGLQAELTPEVPEDQITLARADQEKDCQRLISYAVGCMMARYRLDRPGLIYAHEGNMDFEKIYNQPHPHPSPPLEGEGGKKFLPDVDGIIPVMDMDWFPDDAANRFEEFLKVAFAPSPQPSTHPGINPTRGEGVLLEENLKFVADSLSPKGNETPRETIRRYMSTQFYKDHLQTYKKRPIYWLFSSGKLKAFECLVYLHRYNETTLSRMRNEYVTPLMGKFSAQIEYLANEKEAASSTAERNKLQKQLDALKKKQAELSAFDDLLRHYADQRISLDLDDGVKVNYGKFGNLLAEVKAVTGGEEA